MRILMSVRETSYRGGCLAEDHPMAWCQELEDEVRSFYAALGHFDEAYVDPVCMQHIFNGNLWATKRLQTDVLGEKATKATR